MRCCTATLVVVLGCLSSVAGQESKLTGKIVPNDEVRINVRRTEDKHAKIGGEERITTKPAWYHVAPTGANVDVLFDKACYVPAGVYNRYVEQGDNDTGTIQLQKTRECLILERRQKRKKNSTSVRLIGSLGGAASMGPDQYEIEGELTVKRSSIPDDADLFPTPAELTAQLEKEAKFARDSELFDTFQYNFAVKSRIYSADISLKKVLTDFHKNLDNQDLFKPVGNVTLDMLEDTVRGQLSVDSSINLDHLQAVMRENSLSPSIRGSATLALLNAQLTSETRQNMLKYFHQQTPSSDIYRNALIARARLGDESLNDYILNGTDQSQIVAFMQALALAKIVDGRNALPDGARTLTAVATKGKDPQIRAAAFTALRPFAYNGDEEAIKTLVTGARTDPSPEARFRATVSLGVGKLEQVSWIHKILLTIATRDPSFDVRRAAKFSLSGSRWFNGSLRR